MALTQLKAEIRKQIMNKFAEKGIWKGKKVPS